MSCPNASQNYPINRVFATTKNDTKKEFLRGVVEHHPLTKCSEAVDLHRHIKSRKAPGGLMSYRVHDKDTYYYNLPLNSDEIPDFIQEAKCRQVQQKSRLSLDEKRYSIKRLFEVNSVKNMNSVSKGALLRIFATLCPHLTIDLFCRLLERYGLDKEYAVTFRQFEEAFTAHPLGKREPPVIFEGLGAECYLSVAQTFRMLQEIACDPKFDLKRLLPPSCFEPDGHVLCPQLRKALQLMRLNLTEENFRRLWTDKLDMLKVGSITTKHLCRILGLKEDGTPIGIHTPVTPLEAVGARGVPKLNRDPRLIEERKWPQFTLIASSSGEENSSKNKLKSELPTAGGTSFPLTKSHDWRAQAPGGANSPLFGCGDRYSKRLRMLEEHNPRFFDVMMCLRYKLENPYQSMLVAFKRQDPKHENRVRETDCLGVLREYGLPINASDLATFLRGILSSSEATGWGIGRDKPPTTSFEAKDQANIRPGLVPYKRLLLYYQNRAKGSRARQIMKNLATKTVITVGESKAEYLTPAEIEEEFVKILHGSYMRLRKSLSEHGDARKCIEETAFRRIINETIDFDMTDEQWENLKKHLKYTESKVINWQAFIDAFNHPSGVSEILTKNVFDASESHCPPTSEKYRGEMRDLTVLLKLVENTLRSRLRHIDRSYKHYDQKELNMISKEDFVELLAVQGLELIPAEVEYLWGLLDQIEPGQELHNYRQVLKFFFNGTRQLITEELRRRRHKKFQIIRDPNLDPFLQWSADFKNQKAQERNNLLKAGKIVKTICPRGPTRPRPSDHRLTELCTKLESLVQKDWDRLHTTFLYADPSGKTKIMWEDFKLVARKFKFPLTEPELQELFLCFQSPEKDYFNYIDFMVHFAKTLPTEKVPKTVFDERTHTFTNTKTGQAMTFVEVISEIRKACTSQWRTLQEAFGKLDKSRLGKISINQIDEMLRKRDIALSQDDLYHLRSCYDRDLDGEISYHEFLQTTLKSFKPIERM
ncbi:EF-hand calcium-binding domain-containing protein 6 [Fasciola hepatica]|uniref:EF-hand calcium-binding domain-containing protein 6 n=1 Tax=Fasciola hepatica TaxID=6192 RepID=A0A4E0RNG0_FASHE|nr:EF-hand calcium-binding domain-containing protein 6 [Fasciola hepatica]